MVWRCPSVRRVCGSCCSKAIAAMVSKLESDAELMIPEGEPESPALNDSMAGRGRKRKIVANGTPPSAPNSPKLNGHAKKAKLEKVSHPSHTSKEGQVLTLGEGDTGQLGLGPDVLDRTKPAKVGVDADVVQICAGGMHTVCVRKNGEVHTFGCNDEGALGRDTSEEGSETEPGKVGLDECVVMVSAGDSHTAALTDIGVVYIWGTFRDANGSIGLTPDGKIHKTPVKLDVDQTVIKVASGCDHLVCLTDEGEIYTVGNAEQGQLGRVAECFSNRGGRKGLDLLLVPRQVHFKKRKVRYSDVWTGQYATYAQAKGTGEIYSWGLNNYFQLGFGDMVNRYVPEWAKSFDKSKGWLAIEGGQHHSIALDKDGKVYSLGRKEYGRLGLGEKDMEEKSAPTLIPSLADKKCVDIACGTATSFAVAEDGTVYGWGMGTSLQLAQKEEDDLFEPTEMTGKQLETRSGLMISAGGQHTVILASDNQ